MIAEHATIIDLQNREFPNKYFNLARLIYLIRINVINYPIRVCVKKLIYTF